ncbi:hypothetical protein CQA53_07230 [Helicobacter didelphidarum]|uniref:DUF6985 domain-containing protein n=1 Tax=Helicobacter didelphidarum TaxID=2040648 RepID=A0A3D8IIS4_9HELI|nr:hypothetical protein [Helicobacter didelphidarum]RDU64940.1 hypothetical protein CQA53_07230 [Helicobacter didelphidarum]
MKTINDKVFGTMQYDSSWEKQDNLLLFSKTYSIQVVARAYDEAPITDTQRENYANYKAFLMQNEAEIKQKLQEYCKKTYELENPNLEEILTPTTLYFDRDDSWGVLFDTDCDMENGLAFFIIKGKIEINIQDMFL